MAASGVNIATAFISLVPSIQGLQGNISQAFQPAEAEADAAGERSGKKLALAAGAAIAASAAVIGVGLKKAFDLGGVFDDVADTIRVGTGATGAALDGLNDVAKKVGSTIPVEFDKVGSTVADLNTRMGLTGDSLQTVASQFLQAGNILGQDVDINSASAAFAAFGVQGDQVSAAMDTLFRVSQATGVGMNELTSAAKAQAPALQELGFGFEDTVALVGSLDKAGLNATAVTASLGKGLVKLAKDGEQPQEAFQRITGEISDLVSQGQSAQAIDLAAGIFGTKGATQFVGAVQSGTLNMQDLLAATGATTDTILGLGEETADAAESWQLLKNKAMLALEPIGTAVFNLAGDGMGKLVEGFDRLNAKVQSDVLPTMGQLWSILADGSFTGGGLLAEDSPIVDFLFTIRDAVGGTFKTLIDTGKQVFDTIGPPLMEAFGTIWEAVKPLVPTFLELFQAFNPVGLLFKAILPVLPQIAGMLGDLATVLADGIAQALRAVAPLFEAIVGVINRLLPFITQLVASLLPPLMRLFERLSPLLGAILDALLPVVEAIISALIPAIEAILPVVERVFTFIADTIGNIIDVFSGVIDFLTGVFTGDWSLMWQGVQEIFGGVWDQIKNTVSLVWDTISAIIKAGWENLIRPVFDAVMAGVTSVGDFFSRLWTDVVAPVWQWISDKITAVWNWIRDSVFKPLNDGVVAVGGFFSDLWDTVSNVWTWISDKVSTVWNWIRDGVFAPLNAGIQGVGQFFSDLWGTVSDVWQWIQDKISGVWTWLNQNVFAPMNLAINTVSTFMSNLWLTVQDVWGKISGFFSDVASGISSAVDTVKGAIADITKAIEDFLAEKFGLDDRPNGVFGLQSRGELLGVGPGSARGGIVPGVDPGRRDNVLMPLRSEEAVMVPEFTRAVGGAAGVYAMNRAAEAGRLSDVLGPGFARGGVVGQWAHDAVVNPVMAFFGRIIDDFLAQFAAGGGVAPDGARGRFLDAMRSKIGTEYVWGAAGPNVFDCSGLISWALEQAGVGKGRLTAEGFNSGFPHTTNPAPGDMITFDTGRLPGQAGHIGAVSDPSRSMMIHTDGAGPAREQSYAGRPGFLGFVNVIGEEFKPKAASNLSGSEGDPATGTLDRIINKIKAGGTGVPSVSGSGTWGTTAKLNTNTPDQWANDGTMAMVGPVPPGGAVDRWRPMYADALMAKGMYSDTALDKMMYQMQRESSGNPLAINKSDRNWRAGYPSKSLLQVIGPTFRDNGEPGFNTNIWDPWSNALASLNYVYKRYGGPQNYPGGAYDQGGWLMPGGSGVNFLNKPEAVLTPTQSDALIVHAQNLASGFSGRAPLEPDAIRQALDGMSMQLTDEDGNSFTARMRSTARAVVLDRERALRRH